MGYHWFDAPAYEDLDRKLALAIKYSVLAGLGIGTISAYHGAPRTVMEVVIPVIKATCWTTGSAVTGTLGIYSMARLRMKDDVWNYAFGGAATPIFWGLMARDFGKTMNYGLLYVPLLMAVKAFHSREDNEDSPWAYCYPRSKRGGTAWGARDSIYFVGMRQDPGYTPRQGGF